MYEIIKKKKTLFATCDWLYYKDGGTWGYAFAPYQCYFNPIELGGRKTTLRLKTTHSTLRMFDRWYMMDFKEYLRQNRQNVWLMPRVIISMKTVIQNKKWVYMFIMSKTFPIYPLSVSCKYLGTWHPLNILINSANLGGCRDFQIINFIYRCPRVSLNWSHEDNINMILLLKELSTQPDLLRLSIGKISLSFLS